MICERRKELNDLSAHMLRALRCILAASYTNSKALRVIYGIQILI